MRMRFWATIRSPAFSISALIAPVRLRSVASGLIIEKVRSIAMISSLRSALTGSCGAYIGAVAQRQAIPRNAAWRPDRCPKLQQIHEHEPRTIVIANASRLPGRTAAQFCGIVAQTPPGGHHDP